MLAAILITVFTSCKKEESTMLITKVDKGTYLKESEVLFSRIKNKLSPTTVNGSFYQVNSENTTDILAVVKNEMVSFIGETEGQEDVNAFNETLAKLQAEINVAPSLKPVDLPETITEKSADRLINEVFSTFDDQVKTLQLDQGEVVNETTAFRNQLITDITTDAKEVMQSELLKYQESKTAGESTGPQQAFDASGLAFNTDKSLRSTVADFKNSIDDNKTLSHDQKNALYGKANYLLSSLDLTIGLALIQANEDGGNKITEGLFNWLGNVIKTVAKVVIGVAITVAIVTGAVGFSSTGGTYFYTAVAGFGGYLYFTQRIIPWINSWW